MQLFAGFFIFFRVVFIRFAGKVDLDAETIIMMSGGNESISQETQQSR